MSRLELATGLDFLSRNLRHQRRPKLEEAESYEMRIPGLDVVVEGEDKG